MKIKKITKSEIFHVVTDEAGYYEYIRHSATCWTRTMGESDEPVYDCEELEALFQKRQSENN